MTQAEALMVARDRGVPVSAQRPVFAVDIDGTLGDYHGHFLTFAEGWLGRQLPLEYDGMVPLHKHMGVSKTTYRQIKLAYRMGGLKRSMPAFPWAGDLTRQMRSWGAEVWLCTTRPYLAHDNIDGDTRHWLRRNRIPCNGVIWGEHKYRELVRTVGRERVVCVLDDLPEMLDQAASLVLDPVLALRLHNAHAAKKYRPHVVATYEETVDEAWIFLEAWKEAQL